MEAVASSNLSGATPCKAALSSLHCTCAKLAVGELSLAAALLLWSFRHCHVDEGQASLEGATRDMLNASEQIGSLKQSFKVRFPHRHVVFFGRVI